MKSYGEAEISGQAKYCHIYIFNEALFGQSYDHLKTMEEETQTFLRIDFSHYYVCRTGIPKRWYSTRMGIARKQYVDRLDRFRERVSDLLQNCGYKGDMDTVNYDGSKQVAVLFYPVRKNCSTPAEVAEGIMALYAEAYQEEKGFEQTGLANLTTLSPCLHSYEELAEAFDKISRLGKMAFFLMSPVVLDEELYCKWKRPYDFRQAQDVLNEWEQAFFAKEYEKMELILKELLENKVKYSFDETLCRRVLEELKERLLYLNETFDYTMADEIDRTLEMDAYASIEELSGAVRKLSEKFMQEMPAVIHKMSRLSLEAIRYIRENYNREIGLRELADSLNVAPAYMSRVFNREVGVRIPAFLTRIRMDKARQLLTDTDLRVSEIARMVGIENIQYFNVLFKKHVNMSPQEYRNLEWEK